MPAESTIVLFPRYTTLIGADLAQKEFTTLPLDVSRFGSAQFRIVARGLAGQSPLYAVYLEESLDTETWQLGASAPVAVIMNGSNSSVFVSYAFRLRWFRLRVTLEGVDSMLTLWAEGLLR